MGRKGTGNLKMIFLLQIAAERFHTCPIFFLPMVLTKLYWEVLKKIVSGCYRISFLKFQIQPCTVWESQKPKLSITERR